MKCSSEVITTAVAVFVGASALALLYFTNKRRRRLDSSTTKEDDASLTFCRLNEFEDLMCARGVAPISTITWFQGDHQQAAHVVKKRVQCILEANPWLTGRIVKRKSKNYLAYSSSSLSVDELFTHVAEPKESPISRDIPFADLGKTCADSSLTLTRKNHPEQLLWKVSLVPCSKSPLDNFCIIPTMSHIVGDGHTYYVLWNMLMGAEQVRSLDAARIDTTQAQQEFAMGGQAESRVMTWLGFMLSALRGVALSKLVAPIMRNERLQIKSRCFLVDSNKLQKLKQQAVADDTPFVSTNDVVTSWYFSNCACQHGLMAINFRSRLEGHTDTHAGNYENLLYYQIPKDTCSPVLIRRSVSTCRRVVTALEPLPAWWDMAREDFALIANWASFIADTVDIPNCQEQLHLPVYDPNVLLPNLGTCLVFRARPQQLAVVIYGTEAKLADLVDAPFEAQTPFE